MTDGQECKFGRLFGDTEPREIARILRDDWSRFGTIAFIVLGIPERWDAALDEIVMIRRAFVWHELDLDLTDKLFELMYDRLRVLPEIPERFERLMATLAVPSQALAARLRADFAMNPEERRSKNTHEWLAAYKQKRAASGEDKSR